MTCSAMYKAILFVSGRTACTRIDNFNLPYILRLPIHGRFFSVSRCTDDGGDTLNCMIKIKVVMVEQIFIGAGIWVYDSQTVNI